MNEETKEKKSGYSIAWKIFLVLCFLAVAALAARRILTATDEVDVTPLSTVSTMHPEINDIEIETSLVATKMPGDMYYVIPMAAGEVKKIYVSVGDHVNSGDKICEIDNKKQVDAAKIQLDAAQVQVNTVEESITLAKTNLDRMEALYKAGDISAQSYEQVKASYDQAVAGLEGAKLQYDGAKLSYDTQLEFSTVTAPATGTIETTNMTLNNIATQSSPIAVISADGSGKLQFNVTDRLLGSIKAGDKVKAEKQGETYECTVTEVSTMPGQSTGLYLVEAEIKDDSRIPTGASVKVHFVSESVEDALTVPTDSIYYDGGISYVFTVTYDAVTDDAATILPGNAPATVHKIRVSTGLSDSERTEITEGISSDDEVIKTWTAQLYEGAKVQVLGGHAQ